MYVLYTREDATYVHADYYLQYCMYLFYFTLRASFQLGGRGQVYFMRSNCGLTNEMVGIEKYFTVCALRSILKEMPALQYRV